MDTKVQVDVRRDEKDCEKFRDELFILIKKHGVEVWCASDGDALGITKGHAIAYANM